MKRYWNKSEHLLNVLYTEEAASESEETIYLLSLINDGNSCVTELCFVGFLCRKKSATVWRKQSTNTSSRNFPL